MAGKFADAIALSTERVKYLLQHGTLNFGFQSGQSSESHYKVRIFTGKKSDYFPLPL